MPRNRPLKIAAAIAVSFCALAAAIIFSSRMGVISVEVAKLMLAGLLGMYVGFGVLIAVYRLISKME